MSKLSALDHQIRGFFVSPCISGAGFSSPVCDGSLVNLRRYGCLMPSMRLCTVASRNAGSIVILPCRRSGHSDPRLSLAYLTAPLARSDVHHIPPAHRRAHT